MFRWWTEKWQTANEYMRDETMAFKKFSIAVYGTKELVLTSEEKSKFEVLRKQEDEDYTWRTGVFWPLLFSGIVYVDTQIIIPYTKTTRSRIFFNFFFSFPILLIACHNIVFRNQKIESLTYAKELSKKYGISITDEDRKEAATLLGDLWTEKPPGPNNS